MRTSLLVAALIGISTTASAKGAENGIFVNTQTLNGIFVNGIFVNGKDMSNGYVTAAVFGDETINGVKPPEATKAGFALYYPHIEGTGLAGWAWDWSSPGWVWRTGDFFKGLVMPAGVYNPTTGATEVTNLRIVDVQQPPGAHMMLHTLQVQGQDANGNTTWAWMCGVDPATNRPIPAIALRGEWSMAESVTSNGAGGDQISDSPYRVTFSCVNGALGKCAAACDSDAQCAAAGVPYALGYQRWLGTQNVWMFDHFASRDYVLEHQACTRMIRADYCGNGHSWTATGTPIDVYDRFFNHQEKPYSSLWNYEATWNEDGAVRVSCDRLKGGSVTCARQIGTSSAAIIELTSPMMCYPDNGLSNAKARMGNLRRIFLSIPFPTF